MKAIPVSPQLLPTALLPINHQPKGYIMRTVTLSGQNFNVQPLLTRNLRDLRAQGIDLIGGGFQTTGDNVDLILRTAGFTDEQTDPLSPKELFDLFKAVTDESFGKAEEIKN